MAPEKAPRVRSSGKKMCPESSKLLEPLTLENRTAEMGRRADRPADAAAAKQTFPASAPPPHGNGGSVAPCKCKRNRCLKRYCPCFALGRFCGEACRCSDCRNRSEHQDLVLKNIARVRKRNKNGFGPRTALLHAAVPGGAPPRMAHKKGCRCPRSRCVKKYCECYEAGVMCSKKCKCVGCSNPFGARLGGGKGGQGAPKLRDGGEGGGSGVATPAEAARG